MDLAHAVRSFWPVMMPSSGGKPRAEIIVVETASVADHVLVHHAPAGEINHVLCREENESFVDFASRVLPRVSALRPGFSVLNLSYVVGPSGTELDDLRFNLIQSLGVLLEAGGRFTLLAWRERGEALFRLANSLAPIVKSGVVIRTQPLT